MLAAELKSKDGTWTALNFFYWTAAYNTNSVKAEDAPKTFQDLLDPKWSGLSCAVCSNKSV